MSGQPIGVCSICGGVVEVYSHSLDPIAHCKSCGAQKNVAGGGHIIDMSKAAPAPIPRNSISLDPGYPAIRNPASPVVDKRSQFKLKLDNDKK